MSRIAQRPAASPFVRCSKDLQVPPSVILENNEIRGFMASRDDAPQHSRARFTLL
jgi:hypothetical protein